MLRRTIASVLTVVPTTPARVADGPDGGALPRSVDLSGLSTGAAKAAKPIAQLSQTVVHGARTFDYAANDAWRLAHGFETIGIMGARGYRAAEAVGTAVGTAGKAARGASTLMRGLSSSLTGLGRAAYIPALGRLGAVLRVMMNPVVAIPAALVLAAVAIYKLSSAAADAARDVQKYAAAMRMLPAAYQKATAAGYKLGISQDRMRTSLGGITRMIAGAAKEQEANTKAYNDSLQALRDLQDQQRQSAGNTRFSREQRASVEQYSDAVSSLNEKIYQLQRDKKYAAGPEYAAAYDREIEALQEEVHELGLKEQAQARANRQAAEERADAQKQAADQKALAAAYKAVDEAARAAERSSNPLVQLGISAKDATGALKTADQVMYEVADALQAMGPGAQRSRIEFDLIAAGIDQKLIPALRQGASAYRNFVAAGSAMKPALTPEELAAADAYDASIQRLAASWEKFKQAAASVVAPLTQIVLRMGEDFFGTVAAGFGFIIEWAGKAADAVKTLVGWFAKLFSKQAEAPAMAQGGAAGTAGAAAGGDQVYTEMAGGGRVRGPGTPTSDSILAWLSDGEFVLRARAVRHYGLDLLNSLNGLRLPRGSLRGFNMGGLVDSLQVLMPQPMRFADGGAVPAGGPSRVLNLTIGGETFAGLIAPEAVAQKIAMVATKSQVRSTGRQPSWVR